MRAVLAIFGLVAGCGKVTATVDAPTTQHDAPSSVDGKRPDAAIDAPASMLLTPKFHWTFDGNTNNTGSVTGFALQTPAGINYVTGRIGTMAGSFASGQYSNVAGMRAQLGTYAKVTFAWWQQDPGNASSVAILDDNNRSTSPYGGVQLGFSGSTTSLCVSTTTNAFLSGSCGGPNSPSANAWHHWIIRYDGTGTGTGQGGPTDIYVDDVLLYSRANDSSNNPVFTSAIPDTFTFGAPGFVVDDLKIFDQTFDVATQCTGVIGGTYSGSTCTLP